MDVRFKRGDLAATTGGAIALGLHDDRRSLDGAALAVDRATRGAVSDFLTRRDFSGRLYETAVLYPKGIKAKRVILVGLGKRADFDARRARLAAAQTARRARDLDAGTLAIAVPDAGDLEARIVAQATAEGLVLGHYRFGTYRRSGVPRALARATVVADEAALEAAVERGARWAEATCLARDLANTPGQDLVPERLAARALEIGRTAGAAVEVLGVAQMERLGMGALLAVGRGSIHEPRFIVLDSAPPPKTSRRGGGKATTRGSRGTIVVIGKGVTFDTGGLSLKPRENMHKMKYDMSGAAAVLALFTALPTLDLPFRVVGLVPSAENMPGGRAIKPGDVVRAMDGTTIEITNTDAEGRLILADALVYARRYEPLAVVDLATLTGAVSIALGNHAAGLFTADDELGLELSEAAAASGERLWPLPLWDDYAPDLRSETADMVNSSMQREGGAILGAVFLKHFARGMRWAHLDIASTAWSSVERPHETRGATGFGVRLLLEWLSRRASAAGSTRGGA